MEEQPNLQAATAKTPPQALTHRVILEPNDAQRLSALCGPFDQNIKHLEKRLAIYIRNRGNEFQVSGPEGRVEAAVALLHQLYRETNHRETIEPDFVHLYLQEAGVEDLLQNNAPQGSVDSKTQSREGQSSSKGGGGEVIVRTYKKTIKPRGTNQLSYTRAVRQNDINFGIGPAGTGKTFLAVACAVEALEAQSVSRILLVRPAVEAGEKLGFLPGDLAQKVDPYLRPLYDALHEMLGFETVAKLQERNVIEIAPLAYMRGRTLNGAYILLDESQNTTREQMKMFLTRIGFGSTAVITGDMSQVDLPRGVQSGLVHACEVLKDVEEVSFTHFISRDVVRHPIVQSIVDAYDAHEKTE